MYENEIYIPKGTTCKIYVSIEENGEPYEPESGDVVRFGVKLEPEGTNFDISKTADYDSETGQYVISLAPADTAGLQMDERYWYDIGLQTADGDYYMIVRASYFYVTKAITGAVTT